MPVQECQQDGKPGYRWGRTGKCYTYTSGDLKAQGAAKLKAELQGKAIEARRDQDA